MDTEFETRKTELLLYDRRNDYSTCSLRKNTFTLAPLTLYKKRSMLAENGYYFNGKKSEVKCYLCGVLTGITDEDSLSEIESKHFDKCKFFRKIEEESEDEIDGIDHVPGGPNLSKQELELVKKENEKLTKFFQCRRCKVNRIQTLFLPCRHLVTCENCAESLDFCIHCQEKILGTVKTYIP